MRYVGALALLALLVLASHPVQAQQALRLPAGIACGAVTITPPTGMSPPYMDEHGNLCTSGTTSGGAAAGASGTPNEASVSCASTTTTLLAAGAASSFILIQNAGPTTAYVNVSGASAVANSTSLQLTSGQSMTWSASSGYLPTSLISCIVASGTQTLTVVSK